MPLPRNARLTPLLSRIDIAAILIVFAGLCLFLVALLVMAAIALVKWLPTLWADSVERSLVIIIILAAAWIAARGKRIYLV